MDTYLAIDIGGTFIKYGIVSENAEILESGKVKTPKTLEELLMIIEKLAQSHGDVKGVAVSSPGAVSDEGVIYGSSALPYLHGPNIKDLLKARTLLPVYMENDANCAGYAEVWNGSAKGKKDVIVMVIGTGIGGSVFKNGELHKGANLHGGEIGYMILNGEVQGNYDVWSRLASTKALVKNVAKAKRIDSDSLSGEQIFQLAEAGDVDCLAAVEKFYHLLAVGIYNLQYIYDPEVIVIGGGISARDDLVTNVNQKLDEILEAISLAKIKPKIAACQFRQNANILGAVYGFIQSFERGNNRLEV
ncbi:ROK family protein [Neobacillus niacini]|uniref:ROK family protein n=1 Tax=Neobacillus niacini TaxID=86668 RepID=UPI0021CB1B26|nr:ROK family protein [Neobacillus niacini]MCM3766086.1 ROK family protein [Neobacillus niacini]